MKGFVAGFLTASALAVGAWFLWLAPPPEREPEIAAAPADAGPGEAKASKRPRRHRRRARRGEDAQRTDDRGVSDDLTPGGFDLDLGTEGGERPLSNSQVEATIDRSWGRIRRCILRDAADRDTPAHGTVRLGIRIRSDGSVAAVTANAPAPLRGGDLVPCLRTTIAGLRFPSFEGRDAVVTYPIRIE